MSTPPSIAWPEGVIARYLCAAAAIVDVRDHGEDVHWRYGVACNGCLYTGMDTNPLAAHKAAQAHAERCRAMPRPA
ncbi:hypothetical protein [Streptomyces chumphonensis]|uniref:hypothetical protein n=1 Tax=Streptomyces chumphonensis TaxID=1214925 RepID=UPI003D753169